MNHPEHADIQSPHLRDAVGVDSCWRGYCMGLPTPALEFGKGTLALQPFQTLGVGPLLLLVSLSSSFVSMSPIQGQSSC